MTDKRSEDFYYKRDQLADARADKDENDTQVAGSLPQKNVEDRENVSDVTPEDYPAENRALSRPD